MLKLPQKIEAAIEQLAKLPGVGRKSAQRYALFLAQQSSDGTKLFAESLAALADLQQCDQCGLYLDDQRCLICSSHRRQESRTICVIEGMSDCLAIENSEQYFGLYHILGGVLNPLLGIGPEELHLDRLLERVKQENIESVILAISPSVEGDATCAYIKNILPAEVNVERIGFGIPMGGSFEYLDPMTIMKALENRKRM